MRQRTLGGTGLQVSELGFGCSSYWAKSAFPERNAIALVEQALAGGITYFDTGPSYAAGQAERRLGMALRQTGRVPLVISTKAGTYAAPDGQLYKDWSPQGVREGLAKSLERLGRDRIELLLLHGPRGTDLTDELCATLSAIRGEGLARAVGVNSFDPAMLRQAQGMKFFDVFMLEYNVLNKHVAPLMAEIAGSGAGVIVATPVAQALFRSAAGLLPLSPKRAWELARALKNHRRELHAAHRYGFLNRLADMTGAQAALAFVLQNAEVATAVFGTTSSRHLAQNLDATTKRLGPDLLARIASLPDAHDLS